MLKTLGKKANDIWYGPTDDPRKLFEAIRDKDLERINRYAHFANLVYGQILLPNPNTEKSDNDHSGQIVLKDYNNKTEFEEQIDKAAIEFAIMLGNKDAVQRILEGNEKTNQQNIVIQENLNKAALLAAEKGETEILNLLIDDGANLNYTDQQGFTALHFAVKNEHQKTVISLMNQGASCNSLDSESKPPLYFAIKNLNLSLVAKLKEKSEVILGEWLFKKPELKQEVEVYIEDRVAQEVEILIGAGYELSELLYFAGKNANADAIEILANKGATYDKDRNTPLHHVARIGDKKLVKTLVKSGKIDINAININGETVLSIAVENKESDVAEFLVKNGAKIKGKDIKENLEKNKTLELLLKLVKKTIEVKNNGFASPLTTKSLFKKGSHAQESNTYSTESDTNAISNDREKDITVNSESVSQPIQAEKPNFISKLEKPAATWEKEDEKQKGSIIAEFFGMR